MATTMTQHEQMVKDLVKDGKDIVASLTEHDAHRIHMVMGICGEAGELLDAIKKATIYLKPMDMQNVVEELGDIEFYLEGLRQSLGLTRQFCLDANVEKLKVRYPGFKYTNEAAIERADKAPEKAEPIIRRGLRCTTIGCVGNCNGHCQCSDVWYDECGERKPRKPAQADRGCSNCGWHKPGDVVIQGKGSGFEITVNCRICKKEHKFDVSREDWLLFTKGLDVQRAMPKLSRDNAELLISQICGTCFDNLFKEDEDGEDEDKAEPDNLH